MIRTLDNAATKIVRARRIDTLCDRYEDQCKSGRRPRLDDFLADAPPSERPALLQQLLLVERAYAADDVSGPDSFTGAEFETPLRIGRYRIVEKLGRGGFGVVFKAQDAESCRTVAIKVPHRDSLDSPGQLDRFQREIRITAELRLPGVARFVETGEERGLPFLACEYIDGVTLADLMEQRRLSLDEAIAIGAELARILADIHDQNVVHRDIKPANILIGADGKPRIIDFGLARRGAPDPTLTLRGQILGTPAYMSPEQAAGAGELADARSDIYSLGAVLYQILTGRAPFDGERPQPLWSAIHDSPTRPRDLNRSIPRRLERIVLRCLKKRPGSRYSSAGELADELEAVLENPLARSRFLEKTRSVATRILSSMGIA